MSSISAAFEQAKQEIRKEVRSAAHGLAWAALRSVINLSPIWSGAYVSSHRLSVNGSAVTPAVQSPEAIPEKMPLAEQLALRRKAFMEQIVKLSSKSAFPVITISNDAQHAALIEFIGTRDGQPPYAVYTRTRDYIRANATTLVKLK